MSGRFITFEGPDGSGKSTHLALAAEWLGGRGVEVLATREPGGTPLGQLVRRAFLDSPWGRPDGGVEALLVFAARRQHLAEVIDPALAAGRWVLCDRFTDSTLAYQGSGRGESLARLAELDRWATGSRRPDLTLLFDLPATAARERSHSAGRLSRARGINRLDVEDLEFYERVRACYLRLAAAEKERFRVIDSTGSRAATAGRVREALAGLLEAVA
ncbi:MAG: dTMP kinase [Acidobacteriota bacterium]|nr:dTMP kinase [Acidobacteriota bacterium]MDH3523520.1 dTMP kinase [Acidobacteriota bacterium]